MPFSPHEAQDRFLRRFTDAGCRGEPLSGEPPDRPPLAGAAAGGVAAVLRVPGHDQRAYVRRPAGSLERHSGRPSRPDRIAAERAGPLASWQQRRHSTGAGASATPQELENPLLQFHLGIRQLSERRFAAAAESFSRAAQVTCTRRDDTGRGLDRRQCVRASRLRVVHGGPDPRGAGSDPGAVGRVAAPARPGCSLRRARDAAALLGVDEGHVRDRPADVRSVRVRIRFARTNPETQRHRDSFSLRLAVASGFSSAQAILRLKRGSHNRYARWRVHRTPPQQAQRPRDSCSLSLCVSVVRDFSAPLPGEPDRHLRLPHVGRRADRPEHIRQGVGRPHRQQVRPVQQVEHLRDDLDPLAAAAARMPW